MIRCCRAKRLDCHFSTVIFYRHVELLYPIIIECMLNNNSILYVYRLLMWKTQTGGKPSMWAPTSRSVWYHRVNSKSVAKRLYRQKRISCTKSAYAELRYISAPLVLVCFACNQRVSIMFATDLEKETQNAVQVQVERWLRQGRTNAVRRGDPDAAVQTKDADPGWCSRSGQTNAEESHY